MITKRQLRRRDFLGLASVVTIGLVMTACDEGGEEKVDTSKSRKGAMDSFGVGDTFKATEPLTFTFLFSDQPTYPYKKDWLLFTKMASDNNVTPTHHCSQQRLRTEAQPSHQLGKRT